MTVPSASGQQAIVNLSNQTSGISGQAPVDCYDGSLLDFAWVSVGTILNQNLFGGMNVQYVSGVLIPNQTYFTNNNWGIAWSGDYLATGTTNLTYQSKTYSLTLNQSPMHLACQTTSTGAAAFESVTVAAGTYPNALKVVCSLSVQANVNVNGVDYAGTFTGNTTQWFAPGVGLVKLRADSASLHYLIFDIPLTVNSSVELLNQH
jgi:hypothetical protein